MPPTKEQIEQYLDSIHESINDAFVLSLADLPEMVNALWLDITRYGPPKLSDSIVFPSLPDFGSEIPPPPPANQEQSSSVINSSIDWIQRNPWTASSIVAGVVGTGLLTVYGPLYWKQAKARRLRIGTRERRKVVVVLGGDTPLALPLILELERKGYIVIASVSTPESSHLLEQQCHGYVRALVLDPTEPGTVSVFLRSLASTLSRKFPITAGNPHAALSSQAYIHSVISLLTLDSTFSAPLESIELTSAYLPYLQRTHIVPLQVIQALLPLLRTSFARSMDNGLAKSIIVCLPATETHVGLPFAFQTSAAAAANLRAVEILRREINLASHSDTEESELMRNIQVVAVNVGNVASERVSPQDIYKITNGWTPSERRIYGTVFTALSRQQDEPERPAGFIHRLESFFTSGKYGVSRTPTKVATFVNTLVDVVNAGRRHPNSLSLFEPGLGLGRFRHWLRGNTFSVGAGANTYRVVASYLPTLILETLIQLPYILISLRNALLPVQPFIVPKPLAPAPPPPVEKPVEKLGEETTAEQESANVSETGSEADVESNEGDEGWIKDMHASTVEFK